MNYTVGYIHKPFSMYELFKPRWLINFISITDGDGRLEVTLRVRTKVSVAVVMLLSRSV